MNAVAVVLFDSVGKKLTKVALEMAALDRMLLDNPSGCQAPANRLSFFTALCHLLSLSSSLNTSAAHQ
jgi:hypothetical protein